MTARLWEAAGLAPECIRCGRSPLDHADRGEVTARLAAARNSHTPADVADWIRVRIWQALGWPCREFIDNPGQIYAANQARAALWSRPARRTQPTAAPASAPGADPGIAQLHAAAIRAQLTPGHRSEAS